MGDLATTFDVATATRELVEHEQLVRQNWVDMRTVVSFDRIRYKTLLRNDWPSKPPGMQRPDIRSFSRYSINCYLRHLFPFEFPKITIARSEGSAGAREAKVYVD